MLTIIWDSLLGFIVVWSLAASALAKLGLFRPWPVALVTLLSGLLSVGVWGRKLRRSEFSPREGLLLLMLVCLGAGLFALPAEHYPLLGDSAIYPNTAVVLARTGGLTYTYAPFESLTEAQKALFYVPVARQSGVTERSYQGVVNGAFYVVDASKNTIVASRQPVVFAWMGLAVLLFGPHAFLWVTPVFGVLGVLALYFWGKRAFNSRVGAIAALWLLVSFPQIHFSRAPYSEIVGQVLLLGALYAWTSYLRLRHVRYLVLGNAAFAAAFSARIDSLLALATLGVLLLFLLWERDRSGLLVGSLSLIAAIGISVALWCHPYVSATYELTLNYQLRFLQGLSIHWIAAGFAVFGGAVCATLWFRKPIVARWSWLRRWKDFAIQSVLPLSRWIGAVGLVLLVGYALVLRPLHAETTMLNGQLYYTYDEELLAKAAQYMTPWLIGLATLGMAWIIRTRRPHAAQLLSVVFVLSFALIMFWKYTSARVYPVALRRLVSDVLPGICLMGAFALDRIRPMARRWSRCLVPVLAGGVCVALLAVWPNYWFYHEAAGTREMLAEVNSMVPQNAVILFEPQEQDRIVGWLATPLWAFEERQALVLNPDFVEDLDSLEQALCTWQNTGREVYLLAQRDPQVWWPLVDVWPEAVHSSVWHSSIVGQSREFPPVIWRFAFEFWLYRLRGSCAR